MKTGYLVEEGFVEVREIQVPPITSEEVLIKVKVAGICGSDLHAYHGSHPFRKAPMILGHEVAGEIVEIGQNVTNVKVGDRVTVEPLKNCGECSFCRVGSYHLCNSKISAGTGGWLGSFAEYFTAPADKVYVLPQTMAYELGLLAEPLAVGVHAAKISRFKENEKAIVIGTGPIGLLTAVALQEVNQTSVVCTDINEFRLNMAKEFGIQTVNVSNESVEKVKEEIAPEGFDVVMLAVTSPKVVDQALTLVRKGGRVILITLFSEKIPFNIGYVQLNEIEVKGSIVYTKDDFQKSLEILSTKSEKLKKIVTHRIGLNEINQAMGLLIDHNNEALKISVNL
jgi:L-iditol 2-dehydrogenase